MPDHLRRRGSRIGRRPLAKGLFDADGERPGLGRRSAAREARPSQPLTAELPGVQSIVR